MKNRLYRSRRKRVIGGVAAGLGEYMNLDPVIIRVIFVLITIFNGLGIILYVILWIIVPEEPIEIYATGTQAENPADKSQTFKTKEDEILEALNKRSGNGRLVIGIILIALGIIFLSGRFFPFFHFKDLFPVIFIIIGIILILNGIRK